MGASERTFYIYMHIAPNGKKYVGQTCLKPEDRWGNGHGYDGCKLMQRAVKKYGWENFKHRILCVVHSRKVADLFEQHYIAKFNTTDRRYGYNLSKGGQGPLGCTWDEERKKERSKKLSGQGNPMYGRHHSEETRKKMSENRRGKPMTPEFIEAKTNILLEANKKRRKPVRQLDMDGSVVAVFDSISDAARLTSTSHGDLVRCCQGRMNTANGFKWEYLDDNLRAKAEAYRASKPKGGVPIIQLDLNGVEVARYESINAAERSTGFNRNKIAECCHGGIETYRGFVWRFEREDLKRTGNIAVVQLDADGVEIARFNSVADASKATGIQRNRIRACLNGKQKKSNGFTWKYLDSSAEIAKRGVCIGVVRLDANDNEIARYKSFTEAERAGFNRHAISQCCKGTKETYKGSKWRYADAA